MKTIMIASILALGFCQTAPLKVECPNGLQFETNGPIEISPDKRMRFVTKEGLDMEVPDTCEIKY